MPTPTLPEMTLPAPGVPMKLPDELERLTPTLLLGTAALPAAFVPIRLRWTTLPVVAKVAPLKLPVLKFTPGPLLPEMTLPRTCVPVAPNELTPPPVLASLAVPAALTPM